MGEIRRALDDLPFLVRYAVVGGLGLGIPGGIVGLVIGLRVHAATAWAATFEVGLPAAFVGALIGLAVGSVAYLARHARGPRHR